MTALANIAGVSAPGPSLTDWVVSAALHVAAALALWQLAASVGPALPALQRIELPIRWAAEAIVADERLKPGEAAAVAPAAPTPQPAEPARPVEARRPREAEQPADRAPVRRRPVAPAPESAMRAASRKPAEAPVIVSPQASTRTEAAASGSVERPATRSVDAQPPRGTPDSESAAIGEPSVVAQPAPAVAASAVAAAPMRPIAPDPGARQRWHNHLERLMREHKHYPMQARRMRQQGVVTVEARFSAEGDLLRCDVAGSSGFRSLDEAALKLVRTAAELLRAQHAPGELAELRIPIAYELSGS